MNKKIVFLLAVVLAVALSLPRPAAAAGLTVTSASNCINTGDKIPCKSKVHLNVGVSYGDGALLDVAYGESQPFEEALVFEITKTEPKYVYPLRYLHMVPYNPHEEVRKIPNSSVGIQSCIDGDGATNPSCGWTLDSAGNKIPYSQGFCSNRDLLELKTCGDNPAPWRGDEILGTTSSLADSYSTAYCLRQGNVFFDGYEIDPPRRSYEITTAILKGATLLDTITLSPDYPVFLLKSKSAPMAGHDVLARLLGEEKLSVGPPDLSNYILYVPSSPPDHPLVMAWQNNMLLVPREMVTIDGSECNKVGVSFKTFREQAAVAAKSQAGDCLANQLYQLHQADLALLAQDPNAEANYLVSGKKLIKPLVTPTGEPRLALAVKSPELNYSTVALEMDAAQVGPTTNEAVGIIKEASVRTFGSMSKNGTLKATISNQGKVKTSYIVTVTNCDPVIVVAVPAQARTLNPLEDIEIDFDIATSQNIDSSHRCDVTLTASSGRIFDTCTVLFDTLKHVTIYVRELLLKNKESTKAN